MAHAEYSTITKLVETTEDVVVLTLTHDEAFTLAAITAAVGGLADESPRGHVDAISHELAVLGFSWNHGLGKERKGLLTGGLLFERYPDLEA